MVFETKIDLDVSKIVDDYFSSIRYNSTTDSRYYLLNLNNTNTFVCTNRAWPATVVSKRDVTAPYIIKSHIEQNRAYLNVNGKESVNNATPMMVLPTVTIPLFAGKRNVANTLTDTPIPKYPIKCYYARYISFGELVGNFLPVVRTVDNKVGMFDTVTRKFFTSKTNIDFTAGYYETEEEPETPPEETEEVIVD